MGRTDPCGSMVVPFNECPAPLNFTAPTESFAGMVFTSANLVHDTVEEYLSQFDYVNVLLKTVAACALLFRLTPRLHRATALAVYCFLAWDLVQRYDATRPRETVVFGLSRDWTIAPSAGIMVGAAFATSYDLVRGS